MAKDDKLRAVLVGCGGISGAWLKSAKEMDGLEIAGLVDLREEAARGRAEEFGLKEAVVGADLKAVLKKTRPEIVFNCTVPEAHKEVTLAAFRSGCHVLSEKPLADTLQNARQMVAAAQKAGRLFAVTQNYRYNPPIRRLKGLLDSGALGQLTTINCDFYIGAHFGGFRDRMEHVLLLDMAIHTFDAARFLSGADPVSVFCREWNPAGSWYDHDASAVAVFEMTSGLVFNYRGSWCAEGLNTPWSSEWRVVGRNGSARWDGGENVAAQVVAKTGAFFSEMSDLAVAPLEMAENETGHAGLIREFVRCVRAGAVPSTIGADNIKSLAMVFAAIQSAGRGKTIPVKC